MLRPITRLFYVLCFVGVVSACATQVRDTGKTATTNPGQYNEAIAAAKEGDTGKAIDLLKKVTKENPNFSVAYTDLGLQYLQLNELDEAERAFEKSISLDSGDFVAYNHRGVILRRKGDFSGAKNMYQSAIKYKPDYANAHLNIAVLYDIYLYDLDEAMRHYKKYQSLTDNGDKLVGKWVIDLERRISANNKKAN